MLQATEGTLKTPDGQIFPLLGTDVRMEVVARLCRVEVKQRFQNPLETWAEATYLFPLPHDAAVFRARFRIGERVVEARVQEKERARRQLEQARAEGRTAVLVEQERPDLFSLTLTQIAPGESIEVELSYDARVLFDDGEFRVLFPLVAADRFASVLSEGPAGLEQIRSRQSAARERSDAVTLRVTLQRDDRMGRPDSPTHPVLVREEADHYQVELDDRAALANRDFELCWPLADDSFRPQWLVEKIDANRPGTFMLSLIPPATRVEDPPPRDLLLLVDRSFSMGGEAWELAREAAHFVARGLREQDALQVVFFDHELDDLYPGEPFVGPGGELERELESGFETHPPRGGTEIEKVFRRIGTSPRRPGRQLVCALLTDAALGNEGRLARLAARVGQRLFVLGLGPSVNRYLVERLARDTGGACDFLNGPQRAVLERFGRRLLQGAPVLQEVRLQWQDIDPERVTPASVPALYAGQPLELSGRYVKSGVCLLWLTARTAGGTEFSVVHQVEFPEKTPEVRGLERFWARQWVQALLESGAEKNRDEILGLALAHALVTPFTSLMGADSKERSDTAEPERLDTPARAPEDKPPEEALRSGLCAPTPDEDPTGMPRATVPARLDFGLDSLDLDLDESLEVSEEDTTRILMDCMPPAPADMLCCKTVAPAPAEEPDERTSAMIPPRPVKAVAAPAEKADPSEKGPIPPGRPRRSGLLCEFRAASPEHRPPASRSQAAEPVRVPELSYSPEELAWARGRVEGALDLVFVVDETGSMGPYIHEVQTGLVQIITSIQNLPLCQKLRLGLIRYRDHPPEERTFVTRVHPLTEDLEAVRRKVLEMHAAGGGDGPEAVTDALHELVRLNWRPDAIRTAVWIGDAPPHGVEPQGDSFPEGPPSGLHWFTQAESCREMGILIHAVGCEPGLSGSYTHAVEVYRQVARTTRGIFLALRQTNLLLPLIVGMAALDLDRERIAAHIRALVEEHEAELLTLDVPGRVEYLVGLLIQRGVFRYAMSDAAVIDSVPVTAADVAEALERIGARRELAAPRR